MRNLLRLGDRWPRAHAMSATVILSAAVIMASIGLVALTVGRGLVNNSGPKRCTDTAAECYYAIPANPWGISGTVLPRQVEHKEGGVYVLTVSFDDGSGKVDLAVELDVFKACKPGTKYPECGYGEGTQLGR